MPTATITIPVDQQTARYYNDARDDEKRKIQALVGLWVRDLAMHNKPSLEQIMDEASRKAQERGLTPEILESILKGE